MSFPCQGLLSSGTDPRDHQKGAGGSLQVFSCITGFRLQGCSGCAWSCISSSMPLKMLIYSNAPRSRGSALVPRKRNKLNHLLGFSCSRFAGEESGRGGKREKRMVVGEGAHGDGWGDQRWVPHLQVRSQGTDAPAEAVLPRKTSCKATVSLSAGVTQVRVAAVPVAPSSVSPSPARCREPRPCSRRAVTGAVPAEPQHSREPAFICCDSFATDSLAELTANCNPKLSDGSFFQPGSVRNKFVWVIKTY